MDMDRFKKSCEDVKRSTRIIRKLCKSSDPINDAMKPIEHAMETPKKKPESGENVAFEQKLPLNWRSINVIKN